MMKRVATLLGVCLVMATSGVAWAEVMYSEDFETAVAGQSLLDAPLSWQYYWGPWVNPSGDIGIGANLHPGWQGNAIDGSLAVYGLYGAMKSISIPNTGVIRLTFKAWADRLLTANCDLALMSPTGRTGGLYGDWDFNWGVWRFCGNTTAGEFMFYAPDGFGVNQTVTCTSVVDYSSHTIWGQMVTADGATWTTPFYSFVGNPVIGALQLNECVNFNDYNNGYNPAGLDVDNIVIESVPEPSSLLALGGGIGCLGALLRRRR